MKKRLKLLTASAIVIATIFTAGCSKKIDPEVKSETPVAENDNSDKDTSNDKDDEKDQVDKEVEPKEVVREDINLVGETISDVMGSETNTGKDTVKQNSEEDKVVTYKINANKYESTLTTKNEILKTSKQLMNKLKKDLTENSGLEKVVFEFYLPIGDNGVDVKVFAFEALRDIISKLDWESLSDDDFAANVENYYSDDEFFMFNP